MDEFYWATVTRSVVAPTRQQLTRWLDWYTPPDLDATATGERPTLQTVPPPRT